MLVGCGGINKNETVATLDGQEIKLGAVSYTHLYRDIAHPINSDTRDRIQKLILEKYQETMAVEE